VPEPRVVLENAGENLDDDSKAQGNVPGQPDPVDTPILIGGDRRAVIHEEECSLFYDLEHRIGEEHRKLAKQTSPDHDDGNDYLQRVGRDPQVVPQE
jgi:hypothetical protein